MNRLHVESKKVKYTEAENRIVVTRLRGVGNQRMLVQEYKVAVTPEE